MCSREKTDEWKKAGYRRKKVSKPVSIQFAGSVIRYAHFSSLKHLPNDVSDSALRERGLSMPNKSRLQRYQTFVFCLQCSEDTPCQEDIDCLCENKEVICNYEQVCKEQSFLDRLLRKKPVSSTTYISFMAFSRDGSRGRGEGGGCIEITAHNVFY